MKTIAILLALGAAIQADELVLKDGRKVEWKTISDSGDVYEIETSAGTKVSVKKSDVERFSAVERQTPLTGASITFDKKVKLSSQDLIQKLDAKKDAVTGNWSQGGGRLTGVGAVNALAKIQVCLSPPEEYDLQLEVLRKDGNDELTVCLVGGGRQFLFQLDTLSSTWSGPVSGEGVGPSGNNLGIPGKFFSNGQPKAVTFMVRKDAFIVRAQDKDFFVWKGDWQKLGMHPAYQMPLKGSVALSVGTSSFQVTKMVLSSPK